MLFSSDTGSTSSSSMTSIFVSVDTSVYNTIFSRTAADHSGPSHYYLPLSCWILGRLLILTQEFTGGLFWSTCSMAPGTALWGLGGGLGALLLKNEVNGTWPLTYDITTTQKKDVGREAMKDHTLARGIQELENVNGKFRYQMRWTLPVLGLMTLSSFLGVHPTVQPWWWTCIDISIKGKTRP